jgi:dihydropteroate synthase
MRTRIMGILNVTPDSFSDGGRYAGAEEAVAAGRRMAEEGAAIVDVGGESTRPGAEEVSEEEELRRVLPVVRALAAEGRARVSIDTTKPGVADACLEAGATLVNDVTGLRDPEMARAAARHGAGVVVMHMRGTPRTMRSLTGYGDVVRDVMEELRPRVERAREAGVAEVYVDPGIGFAKTAEQSFELLARLAELKELGRPLLVGPSRKSFLAAVGGMDRAEDRLEGTIAAAVIAALGGAAVVRVHDVAACRKALAVADRVKEFGGKGAGGDKILLSGVRLEVHLGVPEEERAGLQTIFADIEMNYDVLAAGLSDDFRKTIDYAAVHDTVQRVACGRPFALIEAMAEEMAAAVLAEYPAARVRVAIRKPEALRARGVEWAGVEIVRSRG